MAPGLLCVEYLYVSREFTSSASAKVHLVEVILVSIEGFTGPAPPARFLCYRVWLWPVSWFGVNGVLTSCR